MLKKRQGIFLTSIFSVSTESKVELYKTEKLKLGKKD